MSIFNAIALGGSGTWSEVANTAATSTTISFPVDHVPAAWVVFKSVASSTSAKMVIHIGEDNGTRYEWSVYSGKVERTGSPTGAYNNGTFTVTTSSSAFATTVGHYVLVYM